MAKITTTPRGQNPNAIHDQAEPSSSSDEENTFFHWWPARGIKGTVEYAFEKPTSLSTTSVYWFDDTGKGECRTPESWKIFYKDGEDWKPVETSSAYGVDKDKYNEIKFTPVTTTGLRLEVQMKPGFSAGIQEWKAP
jgi:hypothetical protein